MSLGSFENNLTNYLLTNPIINMYEQNLALNNQGGLIGHKT